MIQDNDSGLVNGLGVLDTLLVRDGRAVDMDLHFARLRRDCKAVLRIDCPDFELQARALIQNFSGTGRMRIVVTGGPLPAPLAVPTEPNFVMALTPVAIPITPVACKIIGDYPRIAGCVLENYKRTDYTRSFAARQDAIAAGFEEAIMLNTDGNVACASTSNLFIFENGNLITPPLEDGVLAGIVRYRMVESGAREEAITLKRLMKAERVYLTNSITGPRAVSIIDDRRYQVLPLA